MLFPLQPKAALPPSITRGLSDKLYDRRKAAALELEGLVKQAAVAGDQGRVRGLVQVLSQDFASSPLSNARKGGLLGLAAVTVALAPNTQVYLPLIVPPILASFDDADSRVRYYACEALYNVAKVCHAAVTQHFAGVFDALCRLSADTDANVQNAAHLLDRLVKDIVTDSEDFEVDVFIPLLRERLQVANPFVRQLLVGWITVLDSAPDIDMLEFLPEFLDGLLNMLSDANREIRQTADAALGEFLDEIRTATVSDYGRMASILVSRADSADEFTRLTVLTWMHEFVALAREQLHPHLAPLLSRVLPAMSAREERIRNIALHTNAALMGLKTEGMPIAEVVLALQAQLRAAHEATKLAALEWTSAILDREQRAVLAILDVDRAAEGAPGGADEPGGGRGREGGLNGAPSDAAATAVAVGTPDAASADPASRPLSRDLLECLHDPSESVALAALRVLAAVADSDERHFGWLVAALLGEFHARPELLTSRGATLVRRLCVLLGAERVFVGLAGRLTAESANSDESVSGDGDGAREPFPLAFACVMAQALNLILLTADETRALRGMIKSACANGANGARSGVGGARGRPLLAALYPCWCASPVAAVCLCLLAEAYAHAARLVALIADAECDVEMLVQVDRLVQLVESPVFAFVRMRLLQPAEHPALLKTLYGLLCLLPQSTAFRTLNTRLASVPPATFLAIGDDDGAPDKATASHARRRAGEAAKGGRGGELELDFEAMLETFRGLCLRRGEERLRRAHAGGPRSC